MSLMILVHSSAAILALVLGPFIFLQRKGDRRHRRIGGLFVAALTIVCLSGFGIYQLTGHPSVFHALALLSLWTVGMGVRAARQRNIARHLVYMAYAYAGLIAALGSRLPAVMPDWPELVAYGVGIGTPLVATEVIVRLLGDRASRASVPDRAAPSSFQSS